MAIKLQNFGGGGAISNAMSSGGSDSGITSFTERMALKQRLREQDKLKEEALALRASQYATAQDRLNRAEGRAIAGEGRAQQMFNLNMAKGNMALDEMKRTVSARENLPTLLNDVQTSMVGAVDKRYDIINQDDTHTQEEKDIAIGKLNDSITNSYDSGALDLNRITDVNKWKTGATQKLMATGQYTPQEIDSIIKTRIAPAQDRATSAASKLKSAFELADTQAKDEIALLKKSTSSKYGTSNLKIDDVFTKNLMKEVDNPWYNAYETQRFKKNADGTVDNFNFENGNRLIGSNPSEQANFIKDIKNQKFRYLKKDGKTFGTRTPTKAEIQMITQSGYKNGFPFADAIDAEVAFKNMAEFILSAGAKKYDKSLKTIQEEQAKRHGKAMEMFQPKTSENELAEILGKITK